MLTNMISGRRTKAAIWIVAIYFFFRLPWWALGVIAAAVLGAGWYLQTLDNEREAAYARALVEGPPALVDITAFNKDTDMNAAREVYVQAQAAFEYSYDLWFEDSSDYVVMVPLLAADATNATDVLGVAFFEVTDALSEAAVDAAMEASFVRYADFGPVVNLNGRIKGMAGWDGQTKDAFADEGLVMPENPVVIWPYMEGREVALAPREASSWTIFGVISKVAGAIGLLAILKLAVRSGSGGATEEDLLEPAATFEPDAVRAPGAARSANEPLWKQRSGLADEAEAFAQPEFEEPRFGSEPALRFETSEGAAPIMENEPLIKPRRSFGVRKLLIGIVGAVFVLLLANVALNTVGQSAARDAARVAQPPSQEEVMASTVADLVVPDAEPNRHWTDIDVTPIVEWFVAKGVLALSGDMDALMTVGMIAGGVIFVPLIGMFFIRMRRSLAPKTSARFDAMGIN